MARINYVDKKEVQITDIYFDEALGLDAANLLKLDADRLLAGFRETAGYIAGMDEEHIQSFMKGKKRYGGHWEDSLIGGHTLGHYMTAVAQGVINPGLSDDEQARLNERLDQIIQGLKECQRLTEGTEYEGYLFGAELNGNTENIDFQFDNVEKNLANIMTQAWVPWYTMHKILAGLVDAYAVAGNTDALTVAQALGTWISNRANRWDEDTQRTVLGIEYGGMNDVLYELYKVSEAPNREEFLRAAHRFDEVELFERVKKGDRNCLQNIHANTTIPKFLGALCRYEVLPEETGYLEYAKAFWDFVIERQSYVTGGNSEDEHFRGDFSQNTIRDNVNNETCNTYNMLKLSRRLFVITGDKKYADYYENTLINAIMSSQNHETGMTMYFQPMASGYHKVFSTLEDSFWCCTGSGMENFTKLQDSIYFQTENQIIVNLYLASILRRENFTLEQQGDLSVSDTISFVIDAEAGCEKELLLRIPDWSSDSETGGAKVVVRFDDEVCECEKEKGYLVIPAERLVGHTEFCVQFAMEVRAYNLPDGPNTYAFKFGPYVLSAKLGTQKQALTNHGVGLQIPAKKAVPDDSIRITGGVKTVQEYIDQISQKLVREEGTMNFRLQDTDFDYVFTTHYNQYKESYGIYWTFSMDEEGLSSEAVLTRKSEERLETATVDRVAQIARGQYESGYVDEGESEASTTELTRNAKAGGSFRYTMKVDPQADNELLVTRLLEESEKDLVVSIDGMELSCEKRDISLSKADKERYYQVLYRIPREKSEQAQTVTITFAGSQMKESAKICQSLLMLRSFAKENALVSLKMDGKEVPCQDHAFDLIVPYDKNPVLSFELADRRGYLAINGRAVDETEEKRLLSDEDVTLDVYAENFEKVNTYVIHIARDFVGLNDAIKKNLIKSFVFEEDMDGAVPVEKGFDPQPKKDAVCQYAEGENSRALVMDGTYGLVLLDKAQALGDSYTISFWMKPESLGGSYDPVIMAGDFDEAAPRWMNLTFEGKLWSCNRGWITAEPTSCFEEKKWQHVAIVVDAKTKGTEDGTVNGKLYHNGKLVSDGNVAEKIMSQKVSALYFGVNPWDAYYQGAVSEILLFDRALTKYEVLGIAGKHVKASDI